MRLALLAPLAAMLLMFSPQVASAQDARPCKANRENLCGGLEHGDGKLRECMHQHEAELSPECKEWREAWKKVRVSCKSDEVKFCAEAGKERGAVTKCLESHASELGTTCAEAMKTKPVAHKS